MTRIVGLGGSLAKPSTSLAALKIAIEAARGAGAEVELFDIGEMQLPMFEPKLSGTLSREVERLCSATYDCDGMIWSSPLYHGTISGAFKNALDWLHVLGKRQPPYLTDKVIGLVATAGGTQGLQAVNTMEFIVRALRGWAVPLVIPIAKAWEVFDAEGHTADNAVRKQLEALGNEVARAAAQFSKHPLMTSEATSAAATVEGN